MVSNIFYFHPEAWGFMISIWRAHIFQMGWWKNHQLDNLQFVFVPDSWDYGTHSNWLINGGDTKHLLIGMIVQVVVSFLQPWSSVELSDVSVKHLKKKQTAHSFVHGMIFSYETSGPWFSHVLFDFLVALNVIDCDRYPTQMLKIGKNGYLSLCLLASLNGNC